MKFIFLLIVFLLLSSCGIDKESPPALSSSANDGTLDLSFYSNGFLAIDGSAGGNNDDQIEAMVADSEGRVIAVGSSMNSSGNLDLVVWRLDVNGLLDTTFATAGVFTQGAIAGGTNGNDIGWGVTVNSSDEIFVSGGSINGSGNYDMFILKLTSGGSLDTSFNGTGILVDDNAAGGSLHDVGNAIAIDSSGNLWVTGYSDQTSTNRDLAVWKVTASGALDSGFDGDGRLTLDGLVGGQDDEGRDIKIDAAGNIYITGRADSPLNFSDMLLIKLTSSGLLDSGFDGDGIFSHDGAAGSSGFDSGNSLAIASDGGLLVAGFSRSSSGYNDMTLWKVTQSGQLDASFATGGIFTFDVSSFFGNLGNDSAEQVIEDSAGDIVVSGTGNDDMSIFRVSASGELDSNFNQDGFYSHDSAAEGFGTDASTCVVEDSLGRLIIGGYSESIGGDYDATFWRLK